MAKAKPKKTVKKKKVEKETKELNPIFRERRPIQHTRNYRSIMVGIIFLLIAFTTLALGVISIIRVNTVMEYIPSNVYYPNLLISTMIAIPLIIWFIILFSIGVMFLDDDFSDVYNERDDPYAHYPHYDY